MITAGIAVLGVVLALVNAGLGLNADGEALLWFKYAALSDPLAVLDSWNNSDASPCRWAGVVCAPVSGEAESRVVGVVLPSAKLLGSIPDQLGSVQHLRHLDLSRNVLNGTVPPGLFNARELRILALADNELSGEIPANIGSLRQLQCVNLSDNAFAGTIPAELTTAPSLRFLSLSNNYFSGEIPPGFGTNSQPLEALDLSSNLLNGSLPSVIGTVRYLNLSSNRLSGEIPPEIGRKIPENATLDLSYNNLTGPVPDVGAFLKQKSQSFSGNPGLCGAPLKSICSVPATLTNSSLNTTTSPPAIAAMPESLPEEPTDNGSPPPVKPTKDEKPKQRTGVLAPVTIAGIVVGNFAALSLVFMVFIYRYQVSRKKAAGASVAGISREPKKKDGVGRWSCLRASGKRSGDEDDESVSESSTSVSESEDEPRDQKPGRLVMVDGETVELELERLLKASAYILGASGTSIVYKAVLEDGTTFAVRRIGESAVYRMKDFENRVRLISKLRHPNLVHLRGFYWGSDEKLLIYDYAPNGSLSSVSHTRKSGSSPVHLKWEVRLRICRGLARGLAYLHDKKYVHGNLKPSNVLLGADMDPQIGDFGLERLVHGKASNGSSSAVYFGGSRRSTLSRDSLPADIPPASSPLGGSTNYVSPYQAPEVLRTLKPTQKWDVYSFGVLFLELITGRPVTEAELALWKDGPAEERNRALRMVDPGLRSQVEENEEVLLVCLRLGFACVSPAPQRRPAMKEVVQVLERIPTASSFLIPSSFSSSHYC
ncbi:putative LRR receptor-like serine/threonine-protein kinase [Nymphaea thermarum]|nr:putative LRR receptor-like serine/threonine-protein kinase [Nymphaea thermarum]